MDLHACTCDRPAVACLHLSSCSVLHVQLILRAINSAHSAFLAVSLSSQFFESYNVFSQKGVVQAGILIKVWHTTAAADGVCCTLLNTTAECQSHASTLPTHKFITAVAITSFFQQHTDSCSAQSHDVSFACSTAAAVQAYSSRC